MFEKQNVEQAVARAQQLAQHQTRDFFTPFLTVTQEVREYLPGVLHCITQSFKTDQAMQLSLGGITRDTPGVKVHPTSGGELWSVPVPPGQTMQALLSDSKALEAGAREIVTLCGYEIDTPLVNEWLFSKGGKTLAELNASLDAADKARYQALGLEQTAEAVKAFGEVRGEIRESVRVAEKYARDLYNEYLQAFQTGKAGGTSQKPFTADRRYRQICEWLGEVDVADKAAAELAHLQANSQASLIEPLAAGFDKLGSILAKLEERTAGLETAAKPKTGQVAKVA